MERKTMAKWLIVSALACFGLGLLVNTASATTIQNQNSGNGGTATSGNAFVTNTANIGVGPQATSTGGNAGAQQIGSNAVSVNQSGSAHSGDAVVNSQITGVVGGGNTTVQNQNNGVGGTALSGSATVSQSVNLFVGPGATTTTGTANAQQTGDNEVTLTQAAEAISGDAVLNSQVTGVVGGFDNNVQGQNNATGGTSTSGPAATAQLAGGPGVGPFASTPTSTANAQQNGDNAVDATQDASSHSGDAVNGSQINGVVGDQVGFSTVTATRGP